MGEGQAPEPDSPGGPQRRAPVTGFRVVMHVARWAEEGAKVWGPLGQVYRASLL